MMLKNRSRIGFSLTIDQDRIAIANPTIAAQLIFRRLREEAELEVFMIGNEINFVNPWTWNITKWTPFSMIDSGSVEVFTHEDKLIAHFELSILRPLLFAVILSIIAGLGFTIIDVRNLFATIGCLFPFLILIFATNGFLFVQMILKTFSYR